EEAYARGNLAQCEQSAEEGLTILRLPVAKLAKAPIPPHYELFFRCFRHQDEYRGAMALFKEGLLYRRRAGAGERARQAWQRAWDLLEKHFAGFDYRLTQTGGQYDFSVAGRVLRGVIRLREKLRESLHNPWPPP